MRLSSPTGRRPYVVLGRVLVSAVLVSVLAGCGSGAEPQPENPIVSSEVSIDSDGVQSITLVSADDYQFVPAGFTVAPGRVRVTLENAATQLTHSLEFPPGVSPGDIGESIPVVAPHEQATIEFSVSTPGEYAFVCSFHESLGHTGVLSVQG